MSPSRPLPPSLVGQPFSVASAHRAGVGEGRLRGSDLERPFHGVRSSLPADPAATDLEMILARCASYAPLLRAGQFFSHETAARLWNSPMVSRAQPDEPRNVSVRGPGRAPRSAGVIGHQVRNHPSLVLRYGFPVTDPATTWLALAVSIPLDELVVLGDHFVLEPYQLDPYDIRPWVRIAELETAVQCFAGRGARAAASAIRFVRPGAASRPETLLRLILMRAGLPEPQLNIEVTDAAGHRLGRGDLVWPELRCVVEYDGDQHRTSTRQYDWDITRIESFVQAGWAVVRVRCRGLFVDPGDTACRVERALASHGWRR
jgi:hypothetical protein